LFFLNQQEYADRQPELSVSDYLRDLVHEAHSDYQKLVKAGVMTRKIFAHYFHAGHKHVEIFSVASLNRYEQALRFVVLLLNDRGDLCTKYLGMHELSQESIDEMFTLLATESPLEHECHEVDNFVNPLKCTFRDDDWIIVSQCINSAQLFREQNISEEQVQGLFMCNLPQPLTANNLESLCYFFDRLYEAGYIHKWQYVLARKGMVYSPKSLKPISASNYGSTLSRCRSKREIPKQTEIDALIKALNEKRK
jgi:hypothetical protein